MQTQFGFILLFFIAAILLVLLVINISRFVRKDKSNPEKNASYESGEEATGNSQVAFNIKFYVIAVIFLLFEVEILMLFPWAVVFSDTKMIAATQGSWLLYAGIEMFVFVFLLALGLAYVWKKGHLDWIQPKTREKIVPWPVPREAYETLNEKYI
jgi:NADH-quinone oxidoreductase subunit A